MINDLETVIDCVLLCFEKQYLLDLKIVSWFHEVIPITDRGIEVYRVITHGIAKSKIMIYDFTAITYVAKLSEEFNPVEMKLFFSNGKVFDIRPEVELEKCLKELGWGSR
ncbi:MAG TPA: hypothetical protein ENF93_01300 [Ignisphaera sp.]|nr:hypothetical protein [Ignisphaera sp.]